MIASYPLKINHNEVVHLNIIIGNVVYNYCQLSHRHLSDEIIQEWQECDDKYVILVINKKYNI